MVAAVDRGSNTEPRVALVTGASSGIGRAAAVALGKAGYSVALAARRADRIDEAAAAIRASGGIAEPFATDLEADGAPAALIQAVAARFGRLDVLVNNAGWGYCAPIARTPVSAAQRIFKLNLAVPFLLMREAAPHLRTTRGVVVNVASAAGFLASPNYAAYSASKAGLIALSDAFRVEERVHGVGVVSICPGPVRTEFGDAAGGAPVHADRVGVRVQSAEEIARIIVRQAARPGRTVATSGIIRFARLLSRFTPRVYDFLVQRWARRLKPEIDAALRDEP